MMASFSSFLVVFLLANSIAFSWGFCSPGLRASAAVWNSRLSIGFPPKTVACVNANRAMAASGRGLRMAISDGMPTDGGLVQAKQLIDAGTLDQKSAKVVSRALAEALENAGQGIAVDRELVDEVINGLVRSGSPWDGSKLKGDWRVLYTMNSVPLWEKFSKVIPATQNKVTADFDLETGRVFFQVEILGSNLVLLGFGRFEEKDSSQTQATPKDFNANFEYAKLKIFELEIPLPIKGTGRARVLYVDENLRLFCSPTKSDWEDIGLVAVHLPPK